MTICCRPLCVTLKHCDLLSIIWRLNNCGFFLLCLKLIEMVRFQVLTAASMKMTVFWVVAPCNLIDVYRHFRGACCLHHQGSPWWWRQQHLWNDGKFLLDYMAQEPRRQPSQFRWVYNYHFLRLSEYSVSKLLEWFRLNLVGLPYTHIFRQFLVLGVASLLHYQLSQ
jgi:hypothetical protein